MNDVDEMRMWYGKQVITVLVVSEISDIRILIHDLLNREGYSVFGASNAVEVFDLVNRIGHPHLAILDILLPGQLGIDVAEKLNIEKAVPILFMTTFSEQENKLLESSPSMNEFIRKPMNPIELVTRVRSVLLRAARPRYERQL